MEIIEREKFDPEGAGYDYQTALKYGARPDETGHWPSRVPQTGMLLKGRGHPTWEKTVRGEKEAGHEIVKVGDRYISVPKITIRANVPLPIQEGLVSPGLKKAYRKVLGELGKGIEPPGRDIKLKSDEGLPTGITRLLKLYTLDVPGNFLKRGGQALESPDALTSEDLLRLAGETILFGMVGAGTGVAGMGVRKPPLKLKKSFDPKPDLLGRALWKNLEMRAKKYPEFVTAKETGILKELRKKFKPTETIQIILKTMKRKRLSQELDEIYTTVGPRRPATRVETGRILKLTKKKQKLLEEL